MTRDRMAFYVCDECGASGAYSIPDRQPAAKPEKAHDGRATSV